MVKLIVISIRISPKFVVEVGSGPIWGYFEMENLVASPHCQYPQSSDIEPGHETLS